MFMKFGSRELLLGTGQCPVPRRSRVLRQPHPARGNDQEPFHSSQNQDRAFARCAGRMTRATAVKKLREIPEIWFYAGLVLAAVGVALVLRFKPT